MRDDTKNDCEGDYNCSFFIREASKTFNSFSNGGRYIADFVKCPGLNVTAESSSKFKLVVNAYGCFVESDEHNEGHKLRNV